MRSALLAVSVLACLVACGSGPAAPATPTTTPRAASIATPPATARECPERYDDTSAERASDELVAAATKLLALARAGDRAAVEHAIASDGATSATELETLLRSIPTTCDLVWYAQPGRFAVQPRLDDEPPDPEHDALADAIDAADHIVATCDGGCGAIALALAPSTRAVVAAMTISQRPGNLH
jgi:hypothetical protein